MTSTDDIYSAILRKEAAHNTSKQFSQDLSDSLLHANNWGGLLAAAPLALSHVGACQLVAATPLAGSLTLKIPEKDKKILM